MSREIEANSSTVSQRIQHFTFRTVQHFSVYLGFVFLGGGEELSVERLAQIVSYAGSLITILYNTLDLTLFQDIVC